MVALTKSERAAIRAAIDAETWMGSYVQCDCGEKNTVWGRDVIERGRVVQVRYRCSACGHVSYTPHASRYLHSSSTESKS